jgi:RHS repeat-associated protein
VTGIACPGCTVEIFSDSNDEGEVYEGQTRADVAGAFAFDKGNLLTGPHVNATATDAAGNTSEFSVGVRQVTPLALGSPLEDSVEPLAYSDYMLEIGAGECLLIEVTSLNGVGQIWLYGQVGHMPSQARYDLRATQPTVQETHELLVAPTRVGTYYFSVFGWDITAEQATYTIVARAVDLYLSDVQPRSAGNTGEATLNVQGLGFVDGLDVELRRSGSPTLVADDVMQLSSTAMSAHFDLTGVDLGVYDVVAIWPGGAEEELEEAFEVLTGGVGSRLEASLEAPDFVRPDRTFTLWLDYANTGDAEMVAPLFVISSTQGVPMRLAEQEPFEDRAFQILGGNIDGLAGTLPPGTSGRIPIYLHVPADTGAHEMLDFDLAIMISDTMLIDWDEVEDEVRPPDVDPEVWDVLWPSLTAQIGDTWGDYRQALADSASYLSSLGRTVYGVRELFRFEVRKVLGMNPRTVLADRLDAYAPAPGMPLQFGRVFPGSLEGRLYLGPLGRGWSHSYDITLEEQSDGDVLIHWPGSFTRLFASNSDGTYTALPGDYGTLARDGDIFELTEKDGTVYWFRADGQLDYSEDLNDNRVTVVYDAGDRLIEIRHSNGDSFVLEYDAHGCISRLTDHVGRVTEYSYDATGEHLLTVTAPGNRVTTYTYNSPGGQPTDHALLSITYPDGTHQYYAYEGLGRLSEEQLDGSAEWISYTYDTFSRIHVTDVSGETTIISPDEHGRPARMRDALGRDLGQEYSPEFNLSRLTDPTGQPYKFDYDHLGNVIGTENPLGQQVKLGYDTRFSKIASLEDTRGNRSTFEYDDAGNLTALTYPDGVSEAIAYDSAGNPTTYTSRSGDVITYTHNTRGQLLRKDYPDGSWAAYTYDVAGNMTSASDVSGTVTMEYDEDTNLLTRITYPSGHYFEYSYNDAGQRVQRLDQDGHELNYEYDTAGRLLRLYDEHGADFITYEYDAVGRLSKESKGNGTYTTYAYDAAGQILSMVNYALDDTVQSRFEYTYDANGNRTSMTTLDGTTTYKYDLIGQLTGVTYPDGRHVSYEYDEAGNRITITDDGAPTDYTTNEMNQYAQMGDVTYTYDADGNMISKTDATSTTTYEYDYENRLVRVTTPLSGTWKYTYGALGNRVAVEHNGVLTRYVHDPTGLVDVAAEYGGDGSPVAWYIHGLGLVARIDAAGDSAYYAFDATGHARQLTDDTGAVVNTYDYSPFGIPLQVDETIPNPCRYVGRFGVIEEGNGLTFMRARHYDPSIGRFTAVDPIGIAGGVNLYSYVRNNPVSGQDPMGLARRGWMYWVPEIAKDILGSMQEALEEAGLYGLPFNLEGVGELAELAGRNWGDFGSVSWDELSVAAQHTLGEVGDLVKFLSYDVPYWWFTRNIDQTSIPADLGNSDLPSNTTEQISIDSTENIRPDDPNEKVGPVGSGEQHLVSADDELHYVIYFENKPEAGAPAQEVFVADYLDPDLDWSTFRLTEIAWGDHIIAAPENTGEFSTRQTVKDYREEVEKSWWVDVQVALNYASGRARWTFRTVDPETEDLPLDPLAGFLPPNDETGRGDGHVAFTIRPRADSPDGAVLTNKATIIFDTNDPIATNEVTNVIGQSKLYLPLILRNYTPVAFPLHIGDAIPERPVAYQGETFYVKSVQIPDELPPGGHYYFSPKGTPSPRRWWMTHWLPCWTESIYPLHAANARHTHPATGLLRPAGRQCPASIHQWAEQVPADWNSKNRTARCSLPSSRN